MVGGWLVHAVLILGLFAVGTVVGSFLNVCIYRIPWEKSVIWPASHCPRCLSSIAPQDNIPVVSWLALRGECRNCGLAISPRYPLIELLVGMLFAGVYVADVAYGATIPWGALPTWVTVRLVYHLALVALLVVATFIDYDLTIIPDLITVPGMLVGLALGAAWPEIRQEPSLAKSAWEGLTVGLVGWLVGGGLTWCFRVFGTLVFRKEAMGFGDVTLMAMIGAFLGWQAAVLTFFLAPFFGLAHVLIRAVTLAVRWLAGRGGKGAGHPIPFGPYLSMAALFLLLGWPWVWNGWAKLLFHDLRMLVTAE